MVRTRTKAAFTMDSSTDSSELLTLSVHETPQDTITVDELPRAPRQQQERDPPNLQDVVAQQTEILLGMLAELRARQAAPAPSCSFGQRYRTTGGPGLRLVPPRPTTGNVFSSARRWTSSTDGLLPVRPGSFSCG